MPSPLVTATIQASLLSLISNVLAQAIKAYRDGSEFTLDVSPLITFTLFTILSTPPNYLWQETLESWFPSHHPTPTTPKPVDPSPAAAEKSATPPSATAKADKPRLAKTNTAKKFIVDQIISGPINNFAFLAFLKYATAFTAVSSYGAKSTAAGGVDVGKVLREAAQDFPALHIASLKLWPMVALLSFTLVPMHRRVLFGSLVALGWNIYLGLVMS